MIAAEVTKRMVVQFGQEICLLNSAAIIHGIYAKRESLYVPSREGLENLPAL
jgi:hypothetical protein